jgi:lauroyl/myristoyl acyltransferase
MKKKDRPKATITIMFWIAWHTGRLLPLPVAARLLGSFMRRFAERFTRQPVIRENIAKAFPDMTPQKVKQTARSVAANLGVITAEMGHMGQAHLQRRRPPAARKDEAGRVRGNPSVELGDDPPVPHRERRGPHGDLCLSGQ